MFTFKFTVSTYKNDIFFIPAFIQMVNFEKRYTQ